MTRSRMLLALAALAALTPAARAEEPAVAPAAQPVESADVQALRDEVKRLAEQVQALKAAQAAPAEAKPAPTIESRLDTVEVKQDDAVVKGDIPGSFRIPGSDISLRLYGFAELDWVHLFKGDNSDQDYSTFAPYLPLNGSPEAKRTNRDYQTIRESRFGLEAGSPTRFGVLSAKLEGDFNNEPRKGNASQYGGDTSGPSSAQVFTQQATNSYGFRVRHAYGQFGGLLVGQTWSTFMDVDNFPETVDYNGPIGQTFIRQPQIRYAYPTLTAGTFTAALENSSTYVLCGTAASAAVCTNNGVMFESASRMPDAVVRWDRSFGWGAASVRAMTQELRLRSGDVAATKRGWGAAASALVKTRGGADFFVIGVTGGDGLGRYLNYVEGALYDAEKREIVTERAIGGYAGYQFKPLDVLRFNFSYGLVHDLNGTFTDRARSFGLDSGRYAINTFVQQAHAGFFVTPVKAVDIGVECIWANRRTLAGEKGEDLRANFLTRYYIN